MSTAAPPPVEGDARPGSTDSPGGPPAPPASGDRGAERLRAYSVKNMVYSMLAVLAIAFAWWAIMPNPDTVQRRPVDVRPDVAYARQEAGFEVLAPQGLGEGWTPTTAQFQPRAGLRTWGMGWVSPQGEYVALAQAAQVSPAWREDVLGEGAGQTGEQVELTGGAGPASWQVWEGPDGIALVLPAGQPGAPETVVHGTAPRGELEEFVRHLQP